MSRRWWVALIIGLVLVVGAVSLAAVLPGIVRHVAVARIQAVTGRQASIEAVELSLLRGRFSVRGVRLAERDGTTPFAEIPRADARLSLPSLLWGHLWIRDLIVSDSTIRIVRLPGDELNVSDLLRTSGTARKGFDVTVDHFAVARGTVTLEDQAVPEPRTWRSERMTIEAYDLSTRKAGGRAVASSITAGAPVLVEVTNLRLHPVQLEATATVEGLDLTAAQFYLPPDVQFRIERGRMNTTVTIALDPRGGIRADATGRLDDVMLVQAADRQPLAHVPTMTAQVRGLGLHEGDFRLERFVADGTMSVRDPTAKTGAPLRSSTVRARVSDLTWPATTPGEVDLHATIPGGGTLAVAGIVRPPPAPTQLDVRVVNVDLAQWAQFFPGTIGVTGIASADLRLNEPFAAGIPARVHGTAAVTRLGVTDAGQDVLRAQRVEASALEIDWPTRVVVGRLLLVGPRAAVERDPSGRLTLPFGMREGEPTARERDRGGPIALGIGEVVVRDGGLTWRDRSMSPAARLDVAAIDARVTGAGWPLTGPLDVRAALRPPGGGHVRLAGRVGIDPLAADLRVNAKGAELAPYQPYVPTPARVSGAADLDLTVAVPSFAEGRATARGTAGVSRLDVRDGQRTVLRAERAMANGLEVEWPERIAIDRLALGRPWLLLERDEKGGLPLRALLPSGSGAPVTGDENGGRDTVAVTVGRITVEGGGLRVVDRAISPAFAVDLDAVTGRMDGLSTVAAPPAKVDVTARVAGAADLTLRGTVGSFDAPLRLDLDGELREFTVPRANSYLVSQVGWKSVAGQLTAKLRARVDGDALAAKTDMRVSRLRLVKAGPHDEAQHRIGLPLGVLTSLMKNSRGDITVAFPVGGRLSDPRFDFREAMWNAARTVAINAILLPVSWIGRVQFTADSKIERIQVDPLPFEPGTAMLTADGRARIGKLKAFLDQLPEVRLALTPVVSSRDLAEIERRTERSSAPRDARAPAEGTALPREAVTERRPSAASVAPDLGTKRLEVVRTALVQAGVEAGRLAETKVAERQGGEAQVELEILEPEAPRPSKVRDALRRLGVPLRGQDD